MTILLITSLAFLTYLIFEKYLLKERIKTIPMRIAVTGIRGKSSVVRMIASVLREDGKIVLAKTTGSEAKYILPDGTEEKIVRRGITSIIEQKRFIKKAQQIKADTIVTEIMSIHPENHYTESNKLIQPNYLVITNIRLDHTNAMGNTKDEIASVISLGITKGSKIFIPGKEINSIIENRITKQNSELIIVKENIFDIKYGKKFDSLEFRENFDLVYSICKNLNMDDEIIIKGVENTKYDIGKLKIWKMKNDVFNKNVLFVNAFAANDPESTYEIISKIEQVFTSNIKLIGLLNLRSDRGDRTLQWIEELKKDGGKIFNKLYIVGSHIKVVKRKLKWVEVLNECSPKNILNKIITDSEDENIIFGFGNIAGIGKSIVEYLEKIGDVYGI